MDKLTNTGSPSQRIQKREARKEQKRLLKAQRREEADSAPVFSAGFLRVFLWLFFILFQEVYLHLLIYPGQTTPDNYIYLGLFSLSYAVFAAFLCS
ncbi:MAG: hypothetical protein Q4B50_06990, partial [Bacillota bacterium]|nr:hypothetical protein [Bacillota bacterium]